MTRDNTSDLREIIPYDPNEFLQGFQRVLSSPALPKLLNQYYPGQTIETFRAGISDIQDVEAFQKRVISTTINIILKKSSHGLTLSGLEKISKNKKYLFISNHRDIICDPSLFTNALCVSDYPTPKICLGDNLLANQLIIDLVKMNKGVIVKRNLTTRELFKWSHLLSSYINTQIKESLDSVWIAQREGRAKDGNDQTQAGVIKMLTLAGEGTFLDKIKNLHLVPVAISYEYDPCDIYKSRELLITSLKGSYQKAPNEDTKSMITGIIDQKGRIHIGIGSEIDISALNHNPALHSKKDQVNAVVEMLDQQIHAIYKNWPTNYIAYDLLQGAESMKNHYSSSEKQHFIERMESRIAALNLDSYEQNELKKIFLQSYAHPVMNQINLLSTKKYSTS